MPVIDVAPEQIKIISLILSRFVPDMEVWAFGSRVVGNAGKNSDLDIAIITQTPLDLALLSDLK